VLALGGIPDNGDSNAQQNSHPRRNSLLNRANKKLAGYTTHG
jgi:hypothetical protein